MNFVLISLAILLYIPLLPPQVIVSKQVNVSTASVVVQNSCNDIKEKFLIKNDPIIENKPNRYIFAESSGSAYPIILCSNSQCIHYGNMTFLAGKNYIVKISNCSLPMVRIESREVTNVQTASKLPPKIRFRTGVIRPTEYRYDQSRFRRLSVGITSYSSIEWPTQDLGTKIQFRHRVTSKGPVGYMSTHYIKNLRQGHGYFVEVKYYGGQKESVKIQDEGIINEG